MTDTSQRPSLTHCRRIIIKLGSAVLTREEGLDLVAIHRLSDQIAELSAQGKEIILVSSGAVAAGVKRLGLDQRPNTIPAKQAAAAVGQSLLMQAWEEGFRKHLRHVSQILLTSDDLSDRGRYLNARHTIDTLLEWNVIPIINENDTVAIDEIKFGDNDQLAALIGGMLGADLVVLLTDTEGLYNKHPKLHPDATLLPFVESITPEMMGFVGESTSMVGTGGMRSKLLAAKKCLDSGIPMAIAAGKQRDILLRLLGEDRPGTLFASNQKLVQGKRLWIAHLSRPSGSLLLDEGATHALTHHGRSLLPVGVKEVRGAFKAGDPVECFGHNGTLLGIGLSNYSAQEVNQIKGLQSEHIQQAIGYCHSEEVIHRNTFVLADKLGSYIP
jgi:glutamate 5-kinase